MDFVHDLPHATVCHSSCLSQSPYLGPVSDFACWEAQSPWAGMLVKQIEEKKLFSFGLVILPCYFAKAL